MNDNSVTYKNIRFFEGLNPLRFFAAFLVVMHHSETIRKKSGLFNLEWLGLFRNGNNAVTFFFVLSGFLITYLLLREHDSTSTVSVKRFYMNRVLRIWPLYFLLVLIGTLLLPQLFSVFHIAYEMPYTFGQVWYYFLFFVPGLATYFFGHHILEPLWSIGVEEVFYLVWAPLFKFLKKRILAVLSTVIAVKVILMTLSFYVIKDPLFFYLVNSFQFEAMAIGGLGAYFIFNRKTPLQGLLIYRIPLQLFFYSLLAVYLAVNPNIHNPVWDTVFKTPIVSGLLLEFLFLYLIIGVSLIDHNIIRLKNRFLSYLGEISYGIYMYHMLMIYVIIQFLGKYLMHLNAYLSTIGFYATVFLLVLLIASVSKAFFENYFLGLKKKLR